MGIGRSGGPLGRYIEAAALLSHVQMLESRLPMEDVDGMLDGGMGTTATSSSPSSSTAAFGHRLSPRLFLCRIPATTFPDSTSGVEQGHNDSDDDENRPPVDRRPTPGAADGASSSVHNLPVIAMMAVTDRCISAQLVQESTTGSSGMGTPVEVLVVSGDDAITAACMVSLDRPDLTAQDALIVADNPPGPAHHTRHQYEQQYQQQQQQDYPSSSPTMMAPPTMVQQKSLMSGGVVPVKPPPRLAIIVGTKSSRVISIEFSVLVPSMQLVRRKYHVGEQTFTYYEPLPRDRLSNGQKGLPQTTADQSHWSRRKRGGDTTSHGGNQSRPSTAATSEKTTVIVPFDPKGGVTSIVPYSVPTTDQRPGDGCYVDDEREDGDIDPSGSTNNDGRSATTHVWIGFGDGTGVRLHHAGFFPSVIQKHSELLEEYKHDLVMTRLRINDDDDNIDVVDRPNHHHLFTTASPTSFASLEEILGQPLIKWMAHFPPSNMPDQQCQMVVVPVPKYHPTPLAAATGGMNTAFPTSWNDAHHHQQLGKAMECNSDGLPDGETAEKGDRMGNGFTERGRDHVDWWRDYEAIVYCKSAFVESFPTVVFYTSEDQYPGRLQGDLEELLFGTGEEEKKSNNEGGSSNPISAIVGGIFGMFGGGGSASADPVTDGYGGIDNGGAMANTREKGGHRRDELWDPSVPFPAINRAPIDLYAGIEIHDPPRRISQCTVDPNGDFAALTDSLGRVSLVDLSTKQIVRMWKGFRETSCYWIQVPQHGVIAAKPLLFLVIHSRQRKVVEVWEMAYGPRVRSMQVGREAQVISCRQMSSAGYISTCYIAYSDVPFSNMNQVERITVPLDEERSRNNKSERPSDLATRSVPSTQSQEAAARMNRLQQLLDQTNVTCESVDVYKALEDIESLEDLATSLDLVATSPSLEEKMGVDGSSFQRLVMSNCRQKLDSAIRNGGGEALTNPHVEFLAFKLAYYTQVTNAYEILHRYEVASDDGANNLEIKQPNNWGLEAAGWTSTYLKITKRLIDADIPPPPTAAMKFYEFAACLAPPKKWKEATFVEDNGGYPIFLSDSSRTRRDIVARIFRPLIGDIFSFKVVNQIFESLGIKNEHEYKLKCFGEWFTALPLKVATKNAVFALNSPSVRWLKDIVSLQIDGIREGTESDPMTSIHDFCRESEDLVRAFWLATLCREAIFEVAAEKEEKSYGKVDQDVIVGRWDILLRQLRVCLLVSLRLHGKPLGGCPISVKSVDKDGNFSVFQWLARDELTMSQKHAEIVSLETACRISNRAFDPSKTEGDDPNRWKTVQRSCMTAALGESERAEYLVDFDDDERLGALLLFLRSHNHSEVLVCHRALLLASKWGRKPRRIDLLEDTIVALKAISAETQKNISYAIRIDIWQNQIRPIYRAMLFGFDDVQEISPEVVGPLFNDAVWVDSFSRLSAQVLNLLGEVKFDTEEDMTEWMTQVTNDDTTWPPVRDCFILQRYVARNKALNVASLDAHQGVICALRIATDVASLTECIPSFFDLFTPGALFHEVVNTEELEEKQHEFMQDAIVAFARDYHGPSMDILSMGDIDTLADLWDFDMLNVNTLFLLAMYEFGKDAAVDEVLTKSSTSLSVPHFVAEGLDIMCRRLNNLLNVNPTNEMKKIMGTLDADICEWLKEKAEKSEPLCNAKFDVKIGSTHLFGLRLLSLAASADISKDERIKIHSLIVLSGTIVKVLETVPDDSTNVLVGKMPNKSPHRQKSKGDILEEDSAGTSSQIAEGSHDRDSSRQPSDEITHMDTT